MPLTHYYKTIYYNTKLTSGSIPGSPTILLLISGLERFSFRCDKLVRQSNALRSIFKPIKTRHILLPTANPAPLASGTYANRHETLAGNAVSKDCCAVIPSAYRRWTIMFCAPHGASHEIHRHSPARAKSLP
jgi:hypothetical protein